MVIYFINKKSSIKNPLGVSIYQMSDSLQIGDFCIKETLDEITLYLIDKPLQKNQSWKDLLVVDKALNKNDFNETNALLFNLNGIDKRSGNVSLLTKAKDIFNKTFVKEFFSNLIDVLSYKEDLIDIGIYSEVLRYISTNDKISSDNQTNSVLSDSSFLFLCYLPQSMIDEFYNIYNLTNSYREAYSYIRKNNPVDFSKAFKQFKIDYKEKTIYDI